MIFLKMPATFSLGKLTRACGRVSGKMTFLKMTATILARGTHSSVGLSELGNDFSQNASDQFRSENLFERGAVCVGK